MQNCIYTEIKFNQSLEELNLYNNKSRLAYLFPLGTNGLIHFWPMFHFYKTWLFEREDRNESL